MASSTTAFSYPPFHSLPPFFTLQRVLETREKQVKLWGDLIVQYCEHYNIYTLNVDEVLNSPLFNNTNIQRRIQKDCAFYFFNEMVKQGRAEWQNAEQTHIDIYWKTPVQWADIIIQFVTQSGYNGSVLTVYELLEGETGEGTEFHGMNPELFRKAILILNQRGLAELMGSGESQGVKFK
jgi:ESCRT-II complex subunit VPS25